MKLENISKPKIVDFLRVCDRKNWVFPRIRYASVRSKPTLLKDIRCRFLERMEGPLLELTPRNRCVRCPLVQYDFQRKAFLFDGQPIDLPKEAKPEFRILKGPVIVNFGNWTAKEAPPSSCEAPASPSQTPRTRSPSGSSDQNPPSDCYLHTPKPTLFDHPSLGTKNTTENLDFSVPSC